jgi:serine/threonine protein kinase
MANAVNSVAFKMIRRGVDSDLVIRSFRHERQILASLNHPHIARLFDGGTSPEGLPGSHSAKPKIPGADLRPLPDVRTVVPFRTAAAASDLLP